MCRFLAVLAGLLLTAGLLAAEPPKDDDTWWSLKPIAKSPPPAVSSAKFADWPRTPIDRFILAKLLEKGLEPAPPADKRTLLRRVTFDLTGLPPTPEEIDAFLADTAADAYERVVDRLLASPHYGERWARHWMDVVHYAETHGHDQDRPRPNAWPYRDYLIRSFNERQAVCPIRRGAVGRRRALSRRSRRRSWRSASWPPAPGTRVRCATSARTRSTGRSPATSTATTW